MEDSFSLNRGPTPASQRLAPGKSGREGSKYVQPTLSHSANYLSSHGHSALASPHETPPRARYARLVDSVADGEVGKGLNAWDLTEEENSDWFLRSIPRLSHIITCYSETVLLSRDYLQVRLPLARAVLSCAARSGGTPGCRSPPPPQLVDSGP